MERSHLRAVLAARVFASALPSHTDSSERLAAWGYRAGVRARDALHLGSRLEDFASTSRRRDHVARLRAWGERVGVRARDALHLAKRLRDFAPAAPANSAAILRWFGAQHAGHAFHVEPLRWLRLTERQATEGLAGFLSEDPSRRVPALMRALAPTAAWPTRFDRAWAEAEVATRHGRIDLVLRGLVGEAAWVVAVEAKFDHHSRHNPLSDYRVAALSGGLRPMRPEVDGGVVLLVLGLSIGTALRKRLARNQDWGFVAWRPVLRRFERSMAVMRDDGEFRRFRRTLWERTG